MTIPFYKGWSEIQKSETTSSEFCAISGEWGKLGIPNLARTSLINWCWMLQNARVTAFTISVLLMKNPKGVKLPSPPPPSFHHTRTHIHAHRLGLKCILNVFKTSGPKLSQSSLKWWNFKLEINISRSFPRINFRPNFLFEIYIYKRFTKWAFLN